MKRYQILVVLFLIAAMFSACGTISLMNASARGDINTIKALLTHGADINEIDDKGQTALMSAAFNGRIKVVKILLEKGADVNAKNHDGHTALFFAKKMRHSFLANLLKQHGAKE